MRKTSNQTNRREFAARSLALVGALGALTAGVAAAGSAKPRFGLVTYQWGKDWDLPTLIANCEKAGFDGVELRTQHAHGVEPSLTAAQREEVKKRFADSKVVCVGYGSNQEFHSPDLNVLKDNIDGTFKLVRLSHDIGASGVKVKPNDLPDGVDPERTIDQIARALNTIGKFAADYGQKIRLEAHGRRTSAIPVMKAIIDRVTEPNVGICWNCNADDLAAPGLKDNLASLFPRFGDTMHVRELDDPGYPYPEFFKLLKAHGYSGWMLLEASSEPADRVEAMKRQKALFQKLAFGA